ncbi:hypothetical protein EMCRGX_G014454 [Ephydatia muelleri]|eukprot:Em0005g1483a
MAAKFTLIDGLRDALKCPICHQLFENPKILPCLHDICADCLEKKIRLQPQDPASGLPLCPVPLCNEPLGQGFTNVQDLPTNLTAQNLVKLLRKEDAARAGARREDHSSQDEPAEVKEYKCDECDRNVPAVSLCSICNNYMCKFCEEQHRVGKKTKTHDVLSILPGGEESGAPVVFRGLSHNSWKCNEHPEIDVDIYCRDCRMVICVKCAVCPPHKEHDYNEANKLVGEYYAQADDVARGVANIYERIRQATETVKALVVSLDDNRQKVRGDITERYDTIIRDLERKKETLLQTAEDIHAHKIAVHNKQLKELTTIAKRLDDSLSYTRRVRSEDNCIPIEFMVLCETIFKRLNQLHGDYAEYDRRPWESDVIIFKPSALETADAIGVVYGDPCPKACTATNLASTHFIRGREARLSFECHDVVGNLLRFPANPPNLSVRITHGDVCVLETGMADFVDGCYRVRITPNVQGEHHLEVKVSGVDIQRSPFLITVSPPVVQPGTVVPVRVVQREGGQQGRRRLLSPFGVTTSGDLIAVSDHTSRCVLIFQGNLDHFKELVERGDQFSSVRGITFDSKGSLLVVEKENHHVTVISPQNSEPRHIGSRGNGDGQFEMPSCVAVDSKGYVFVTDSINQRVQYFTPDYAYAGQVGRWGQAKDEFHDPYGIAIDGRDRLFVTSRKSNKVHVFEREVQPTVQNPLGYAAVQVFGDRGSAEQKLQAPVGIAVDPLYGYVYVTEEGGGNGNRSRLSVFTLEGEHVASYVGAGQVQFSRLTGVCVLGNHNVVVADCGNQQLVELGLLEQPNA